MLEILNVVLLLLLLITTGFIVFSRHLVVSAVLMCAFSSFIALIYLIMNAPDVAITEASVGAGLSTVFTFAALSLIKNHKVNLSHNYITLFFMLFLVICLSHFMIQLPDFGDHNAPIHLHVAPYYVENTEKVAGIPNIVTAVLASFRGYDTFGETIVVFTAALCITLILKEEKENRLLSKFASGGKMLGVHGAENGVYYEDLSTGATTQLPVEVEFRRRSND